jgi:hypothetical protein
MTATAAKWQHDVLQPGDTLFAGQPSKQWRQIGIAGGDFDRFARYEKATSRFDTR